MAATLEATKQKLEFHAICAWLCENDGATSVLDLSTYGKLGWKATEILCDSLDGNTHLCDLTLVAGEGIIGADALLLLVPFLVRTCTSLQKFRFKVAGNENGSYQHAAIAILNTISYSASLTSIALVNIRYARPELLEKILSKTRTLKELEFSDEGDSENFSMVCESLRRGFQQNQTLESLKFTSKSGLHVEELLFGVLDLPKLASLTLDVFLTGEASNALRFFFKGNETLQSLKLTLRTAETHESVALAPVLLGLAYNRSIEDVQLQVSVTLKVGAAAWTELFQKNKTIKSFILGESLVHRASWCDRACATAIAEGLCDNVSLQKLELFGALREGAFDGAAWGTMIQKNSSLVELDLGGCNLGQGGEGQASFKLFTVGLSRNAWLKKLNLYSNSIGNAGGDALADALKGNEALENLSVNDNGIGGEDGQAVFRKLWCNKGLYHLNVDENAIDGLGRAFAGGFPKNQTLKRVHISDCPFDSDDCRAIFESLHGNKVLEELMMYNTGATLDGSCGTALTELLESTPLRKLDLQYNAPNSDFMTELTNCLRGNTSLRHLNLGTCQLGNAGLLQLAEALVENTTLAELFLDGNDFDEDGMCGFMQLLPLMKCLKRLCFSVSDFHEVGGLALVKGLKGNKSLETIDDLDDMDLPPDTKKSIEFYLKMNRNGRRFLQESKDEDAVPLPFGAWPLILAKMTSSSERDELFHFLRHKGDLLE